MIRWLAVLTIASMGLATGQGPSGPGPIVFERVTVIDTATGASRPNMTVAISGDRITGTGRTGELRIPPGAQVIDGAGKFLIPGLWDMHVHVLSPQRIESFLPLLIANGVTGVRDMATELRADSIARVRQRIADASLVGPRVVVAGPLLSGGQRGRPPGRVEQAWAVTTPDEARGAVATLLDERVDFLKVYSYLKRDVFETIAQAARAHHVDVAGHVPIQVNVLDAVRAGMRSIEHGTGLALACSARESELREDAMAALATGDVLRARRIGDGQPHDSIDEAKCADVLQRLGRADVWHTPTIAYWNSITKAARGDALDPAMRYLPPSARRRRDGTDWTVRTPPRASQEDLNAAPQNLAMLRRLRHARARVLAGTDVGNPFLIPGISLHEELEHLVSAGFSPLQALQSATLEPAKFFRRQRDLGAIEPGKVADLVLLDANPLEDIRRTRQIRAVVANGRLFDRAALDAILARLETMQ